MRGIAVTGWGAALPDRIVSNADIEARHPETTDEWVTERTGIRERRYGGTTGSLAAAAGRIAMERAGVGADEIDLVILATTSPDKMCPGTAASVQHELGLTCGAFDVNAACSGFMYGLAAAAGFVATGYDKILVVGSETLSRMTDFDDRNTVILFGDGAGATVVEAIPGESQLLGWDLGADGSLEHILYADVGGYLKMDGKEVFRRAVRIIVDSAKAAMERAKVTIDDIDVFVPHQANVRIIESALNKLGFPMEKTALVLDRTGNTSSASIPLALDHGVETGLIKPGDTLLLSGFGAGMTWASAVMRWGKPAS